MRKAGHNWQVLFSEPERVTLEEAVHHHLYWLLRISVLKKGRKQHSDQLYGHLLAGEMERKRA